MATGKFTGKILNKKFLENIDNQREVILGNGEIESKLSGNVIDVSGNNTEFIRTDEEDKFKAINELKNYLEFNTFKYDETYEIPGVEIPGASEKIYLYIKKDDISKIADKAEVFERLLGVKFPSQIYQFKAKYVGEKIPGTNLEVPRPKLMNETQAEYEEYLATLYASENIEKELNPDEITRAPYPHEQIEYKTANAKKENYISEYYELYLEEALLYQSPARKTSGGRKNKRINDDDELIVRESDDLERTPLGQKIGAGLTSFENLFKSGSTWQKLRHGAIGTLLGGGVLYFAYANPVAAATLGVCIGSGLLMGKGLQWLCRKLKEKKDDFLYGPRIKDEEDEEEEELENTPPAPAPAPPSRPQQQPQPRGDGGQNHPTPGEPPKNQTVIPEDLDYYLEEAGINVRQYRETERRIAVAETELLSLTPGTIEYASKQQEIASLKINQKEQLQIIEVLLEEMLKGVNVAKTGGRNL